MLFFILTSVSFIFFLNSLNLKPLPQWTHTIRLLPLCFWNDLCISSSYSYPLHKTIQQTILAMKKDLVSTTFSLKNMVVVVAADDQNVVDPTTELLDLPELALDSILERLSPNGLCSMGAVCRSLRDRCTRNNLWDGHLRRKWGRVLGPAAYRQWKWFVESKMNFSSSSSRKKSYGLSKFFGFFKGFSWFQSKFDKSINNNNNNSRVVDSVMSWYLALESGKFWFPAQVYNRENGHVGFMLSCYDAELSYDSQTDTFNARYPPHGIRAVAIETGVQWDRLRVSPVETSPHDLHVSDCLHDLRPGDHVEIQWRRNKEFPYGWWYGVIGHLETCDGNENYCRCSNSDTIVLEFNQYTPGSRWRTTHVSRKDHREEGNESDGFYGGIRKLYKNDEIATWKRLWPRENLE